MSAAGAGRAAFGFISVNVLLDSLSFGLIFPILPKLIVSLSGGDMASGAMAFGWMAAAWALANFIAAPILGALSDRFGRRPIILISTFGMALDFAVMAVAPTLAWLFVGRVLSGITAATQASASAYIADVTPPDKRAARFGLLGALFNAGLILGPGAGGLLAQFGARAPFWAAAGLAALGWVYGLVVLPESLPPERRAKITWQAANPVRSMGILTRHPGLLGLVSVIFLIQLASGVTNSVFVLYTIYRFAWTPQAIGVLLMAYSAGTVIATGLISPLGVKWLGERRVLLWALVCATIGMAAISVAPTARWFCIACALLLSANMAGPPLMALMTDNTGADEQGRLQGALSALTALASMAGPLVFAKIFAWSVSGHSDPAWSGLAFGCCAALFGLGWFISLKTARRPSGTTDKDVSGNDSPLPAKDLRLIGVNGENG